jgi:DNA mismatch endonuclease (patch repair protein)
VVRPISNARTAAVAEQVVWEPTDAGAHLRDRRVRNTRPEVALRRAVHATGLRFRLNRRIGRYTPDFVLPRHHVAVFVDGCFWHGCPVHGPTQFRGPNAERWSAKLAANRARDQAADSAVAAAGWRVVRVWECEIRADIEAAAQRVQAAVQAESAGASVAI